MSAVWPTLACLAVYVLGYRFYARHLARRVFRLDPEAVTPAHALRDEVDYLPTRKRVLFGHHFASITGLSPMLGPAIAVIWGWIPAMVWVVLGAVFIGCVHDFAALVISIRARGLSIGKIAEGVIGPRAKGLFLAIIFFGVALAMGSFTIVISSLFAGDYASAVLPSGGLMLVAALIGWLFHRRGVALGPLTLVGFLIQVLLVWLGELYPLHWASADGWKYLLLAYAFLASVLPVWSLLQPRDFLNSLLLYLGLGMCLIGFFLAAPDFAAPAFQAHPKDAPSFFPFVFITIACGATSGFHALVSSGTTAKQLDRETDATPVGYGGMLGESLLGLVAVLATTAGVVGEPGRSPARIWQEHYSSWNAAEGLVAKMARFIEGASHFVTELGVPLGLARAFIAVVVVSFALTTLDSATRLLRYNVEEIAQSMGLRRGLDRHLSTLVAVLAIGFFAFFKINGQPAGVALWRVFGTVNQLLAGLTLMVATLYLKRRGRPSWYTFYPMLFMLVTSLTAMYCNLARFTNGFSFSPRPGESLNTPLIVVASVLPVLAIWLVIEGIDLFARVARRREVETSLLVFPEDHD